MRRTDPAKLRYPAGRFAALGARGAGGGSGVVGGVVVTAVSSRASGSREWTTPIIAMTAHPMVPGRTSPARRTGLWPVGSPPVPTVADNGEACGPSFLGSARTGDGYGRSPLRHRDGIL